MTFPHSSMIGKTCVVTGASGGIGRASALGLADLGATVLLIARDEARGRAVADEIGRRTTEGGTELYVADLGRQADVRALATQLCDRHGSLDVLVHNAAAVHASRRLTEDGIEATLAVNHLAPFLLTQLLDQPLRAAPAARVITVSSHMHTVVKAVPWDDLSGERRYRAPYVYNLTKLFNIMFTRQLAARSPWLTANALHPGWPLRTELGRELRGVARAFDRATKLFAAPPAAGAQTSIFLAADPSVATVTGGYFVKAKPATPSALARDDAAAERLWMLSAQLCSLATP